MYLDDIEKTLKEIKKRNLYRKLIPLERVKDKTFQKKNFNAREANGKPFLSFSSNDYLGFSGNSSIKKRAMQCWQETSSAGGQGASPLVRGYSFLAYELEEQIARFKSYESSLVFSSGYQAGLGLMDSLAKIKDSYFLIDKFTHASLLDGIKNKPKQFKRYSHLDYEHLEQLLKKISSTHKGPLFVLSDGLFSMDGDLADLAKLSELKSVYNFTLIIDDAHGTGVLGSEGQGIGTSYPGTIDILIGTLSKALGGQGGFICGKKLLKEYLVNTCRPYIYSTALNPFSLCWAGSALQYLKHNKQSIEKLHANITGFLTQIQDNNLASRIPNFKLRLTANSNTLSPIIPYFPNSDILDFAKKAQNKYLYLIPIRPPTVPKGSERIRISLSALHNSKDIQALIEFLSNINI